MTNVERYEARVKIYGNVCAYCKTELTIVTFTIDHVIPLARGGPDTPDNKVAACYRCNKRKAKNTPAQWAVSPLHPKNMKRNRENARRRKARKNRRKWVY